MASKEGPSRLPCCLCLQQKRKSLCGCFCWSWPSDSSGDAQQDAAGSTGLTQPRGCARGGRKKRRQEGCPAWGQHCSSTPREECSLSPQCAACLSLRMHSLLATVRPGQGSCPPIPPALQASPSPLGSSIICTRFSFPFLSPVQKSRLSIKPAQKQHSCSRWETSHSRAPVGCLPPAQCRTCPVEPPPTAGSSCPLPSQQSLVQEGCFWAHGNFCQRCTGWKRSSSHTGPSTLHQHKPLAAQLAHLHLVVSDLGSHMYSLSYRMCWQQREMIYCLP